MQEENTNILGLTPSDEFAHVRNTGYSVELGDTLSKAWEMIKPRLGELAGYTFLMFIIASVVSVIASFIPILGNFANGIASTVLTAGFYIYFIKMYRKEYTSFSDFFEGFSFFGQLALYSIVSTLIIIVPIVILMLVGLVGADFMSVLQSNDPDAILRLFQNPIFIISFSVGAVIALVISTMYLFTPLIIVATNMTFWDAMETSRKVVMSNFLGMIGLIVVLGFINVLGVIPCFLGLLVTVPLSFAAYFVLYLKLIEKNGNSSDLGSDFYSNEDAPLDAL